MIGTIVLQFLSPEKYAVSASQTLKGEMSAVSTSDTSRCVLGACVVCMSSSVVLCFSQMLWSTQHALMTVGTYEMSMSKCFPRHLHLLFSLPKAHSTVILALLKHLLKKYWSSVRCQYNLSLTSCAWGRLGPPVSLQVLGCHEYSVYPGKCG